MLFIDVVTYINYLVKNILEYNQQNGISITAGTAWATEIPGDSRCPGLFWHYQLPTWMQSLVVT